jgi:putative membrane protein
MNRFIRLLIYGAIIGVGAILPGVSGGVLCVAFGLYEPLMQFLTNPKKSAKENHKTLVPFFIGWTLGLVLLAKVCELFFVYAPNIAVMLFFGLVAGTIPGMFKNVGTVKSWLPFVISTCASYMFFHILEAGHTVSLPINFLTMTFCGVLWGLSMIVPGLSSSSILIYCGLYMALTEGISNFDLSILAPFGVGVLATVVLLARLVDMLFKKHYSLVSQIILGFVISSSLKTLPSQFPNAWVMIISIACCVIGFIVALIMDRAEHKEG